MSFSMFGRTGCEATPGDRELLMAKCLRLEMAFALLQAKNLQLEKEIQALRDQLDYAPGGEKAHAAQDNFESLRGL